MTHRAGMPSPRTRTRRSGTRRRSNTPAVKNVCTIDQMRDIHIARESGDQLYPTKGRQQQNNIHQFVHCRAVFILLFPFPMELSRDPISSVPILYIYVIMLMVPISVILSQTAKVVRRATRQEGRWARDTRGRGGRQGRWGHRRGWWGGRGGGRRGGGWGSRGGWGGRGGGRGGGRRRGGGRGGGGRRGRGGGGIDQSTLWARPRAPLSFTTFRKNKHYI